MFISAYAQYADVKVDIMGKSTNINEVDKLIKEAEKATEELEKETEKKSQGEKDIDLLKKTFEITE